MRCGEHPASESPDTMSRQRSEAHRTPTVENGVIAAKVVRASEVAKLMAPPPSGSYEACVFGKVFEEAYTEACYYHAKTMNTRSIPRKFARKVAAMLKREGVYSDDLVKKAYKMYSCLLRAGVVGLRPRTRFRWLNEKVLIAAQPDIGGEDGRYYEFKTYPLDEYARAQAMVFSWVIGKPIVLVGLVERDDGYIDYEMEVVECAELPITDVPDHLGEEQEICPVCRLPLAYCKCDEYEEYWDYLSEDDVMGAWTADE